jgi:hypothetical protein
MDLLLAMFAFALGAIIGSFLNVVIHRYPLGESLVFPGSRLRQRPDPELHLPSRAVPVL